MRRVVQTESSLVEEHDLGLAHDLRHLAALDRRRALGLFGAAGSTLALAACGGTAGTGTSTPTPTPTSTATATPTPTPTSTATSATCTAFARETNGPYPADGTNTSNGATSNVLSITSFQRTDIRSSLITSTNQAAGVPLQITVTVVDVNASCAPMAGYVVYLWHCNALGQYSLYDLPAESYLRGIQVTDANGQATFTTIVPGCYAGRYPHIHFEVFSSIANATSGSFARLISQFAVPATLCEAVYADSTTYGASLSRFRSTSIASDNVFGDNTSAQISAMTLQASGSTASGYTAVATVGLPT